MQHLLARAFRHAYVSEPTKVWRAALQVVTPPSVMHRVGMVGIAM